jgi:NADH:ubiquinone reductase (H+-translocating)
MYQILILGGGFAGLMAALNAADENDRHGGNVAISMVSASPYLTIRPRLYERDPETLRAPLAPTLEPAGVAFSEAIVRTIDTTARLVRIEDARGAATSTTYDRLILATGSQLGTLPVPGVAEHAFNIDNYEGAVTLDRHLQKVLQNADVAGHDTVVIVGGGMTGIELAAEMRSRIAVHAGARLAAKSRVILIEQANVVAPDFGNNPRPVIERALKQAGVEIRISTTVIKVEPNAVTLAGGERIAAATTVIATGMRASPLTLQIAGQRDELGRLVVDDMLRVIGVPDVFATGDVARATADDGQCALMSCQHSLTMGKYAGHNASRELLELPLRPYRQPDYTNTLDLGQFGAVFTRGWDRRVEHYGAEAKKRKIWINSQLIYPVTGDRRAVLASGRINPKTGR